MIDSCAVRFPLGLPQSDIHALLGSDDFITQLNDASLSIVTANQGNTGLITEDQAVSAVARTLSTGFSQQVQDINALYTQSANEVIKQSVKKNVNIYKTWFIVMGILMFGLIVFSVTLKLKGD